MIHVEIHDGDDDTLAKVYMREAPRVGEIIWLQGKAGERIRASLGTSALTITEVAHWVGEEWGPNTHVGEPIHSICVYVEPLKPGAGEARAA